MKKELIKTLLELYIEYLDDDPYHSRTGEISFEDFMEWMKEKRNK